MVREKLCASVVLLLISAGLGRAEFQVNSYTSQSQTHPAVAANEAGNLVVAWRSNAMS